MRYGQLLMEVEKPGRYEGIESGAVVKDWDAQALRVALCFPDLYEIGMSHLGLPILYNVLNSMEGVCAERAYAVWPDMEALLRREGLPLISRENGKPLKDFDLIGFTLQYELSITNVLAMLELGGIPILTSERSEEDPIVLGGGPVAANPEPYADFFDCFFIGEGEEGIKEIAGALAAGLELGLSRSARIDLLREVDGVYIPSDYSPIFEGGSFAGFTGGDPVRRRIISDLNANYASPAPILPFGSIVHDRLSVEVARGCTRGCRFCQAGFLYRPVRERAPGELLNEIRSGLSCTGEEEIGLLSLSTGDYSSIGPLLVNLMDKYEEDHVSISLPSLRIDSLDTRFLSEVSRVRKTGFTLAPEAGSMALRSRINKNFSDEEILSSVSKIFAAGWKGVKLYFMIGLPFETEEDREAIPKLVEKIVALAPGGKGRVTVSVSNFVPKPHTPFQWARQLSSEEVIRIQSKLRERLNNKKIKFKGHGAGVSRIEGIFARGDRRLGKVALSAYKSGCRMDGWTSEFKESLWDKALLENNLEAETFLRERDIEECLPWDMVDIGVDREYFLGEFEKAASALPTGDCRTGECENCGTCNFTDILPISEGGELSYPAIRDSKNREEVDPSSFPKMRFRYSKTGPAVFLSHLDTTSALHKAFRAAGVPIFYSQGFNPHPKMTLGTALPLGTESLCETGEAKVVEIPPLASTKERVNSFLPEGLKVEALISIPPLSPGLSTAASREEYSIYPSKAAMEAAANEGGWNKIFDNYWRAESFKVIKRRANKPDRVLEAKDYVEGVWLTGDTISLELTRGGDGSSISPEGFLHSLLGLDENRRATERIIKVRMDVRQD